MTISTRPLTLGEILDRTIQLYRRNFLLFAGISAPPSAFYVLLVGAFSVYSRKWLVGFQSQGGQAGPQAMQGVLYFLLAFALFCVVAIPLLLGAVALGQSALTFATVQLVGGARVTVRESYAYGFRFFWRSVGILFLQSLFSWVIPGVAFTGVFVVFTIVAVALSAAVGIAGGILAGLLTLLLVVAFFVIVVWIWLRVCLSYPASVAEGKKAWESLKRSNQIGKGTRGRIFVMYVMVVLLTLVVYYSLTIPIDLALGLNLQKLFTAARDTAPAPVLVQVVNLTLSFFERALVLPVYAVSLVLFYNDQRTRIEGYDIQQLMDQAGWSQLPPAAALPSPPEFAPATLDAPAGQPEVHHPSTEVVGGDSREDSIEATVDDSNQESKR
jgi:hypothetical protein